MPHRAAANECPQHMFSSINKKNVNFQGGKYLVGQVDLDHLLAHGQVIKFDNSTSSILQLIYEVLYLT